MPFLVRPTRRGGLVNRNVTSCFLINRVWDQEAERTRWLPTFTSPLSESYRFVFGLTGLSIKINIFLPSPKIQQNIVISPSATNKMSIFVHKMYLQFYSINLVRFAVSRLWLKKKRSSWSYLSFSAIIKNRDLSLYLWISRNMQMVFWKI